MFNKKDRSSAPAPTATAHDAAAQLAILQYQEALMRDFWSGSAAGPLPPAPVMPAPSKSKSKSSKSSKTHSHAPPSPTHSAHSSTSDVSLESDASGRSGNTKWAGALRDSQRAARVAEGSVASSRNAYASSEGGQESGKPGARRLFHFGFRKSPLLPSPPPVGDAC